MYRPCSTCMGVLYTTVYTAVETARVHGRVHVYTARTRPWTVQGRGWPCTAVSRALYTATAHVDGRIHRP